MVNILLLAVCQIVMIGLMNLTLVVSTDNPVNGKHFITGCLSDCDDRSDEPDTCREYWQSS